MCSCAYRRAGMVPGASGTMAPRTMQEPGGFEWLPGEWREQDPNEVREGGR